jgi:hypothetical protein
MEKLKSFEDFRRENIELDNIQSVRVFGGRLSLTEETNNWCSSLNDTCVDNCSDVRLIQERDDVVVYDKTTMRDIDCN